MIEIIQKHPYTPIKVKIDPVEHIYENILSQDELTIPFLNENFGCKDESKEGLADNVHFLNCLNMIDQPHKRDEFMKSLDLMVAHFEKTCTVDDTQAPPEYKENDENHGIP